MRFSCENQNDDCVTRLSADGPKITQQEWKIFQKIYKHIEQLEATGVLIQNRIKKLVNFEFIDEYFPYRRDLGCEITELEQEFKYGLQRLEEFKKMCVNGLNSSQSK